MSDLVVAPLSIQLISGPWEERVAGEAVTAGDLGYIDSADNDEVKVADANAAGKTTVRGIILDAGSEGDTVRIALDGSRVNLGVTLGVGTPYFNSSDAGGIAPLADVGTGETVSLVGFGETAAIFAVHIVNTGIVHA